MLQGHTTGPALDAPAFLFWYLTMERREHWNQVYATRAEEHVSWFEPSPAVSLQLIHAAGLTEQT